MLEALSSVLVADSVELAVVVVAFNLSGRKVIVVEAGVEVVVGAVTRM